MKMSALSARIRSIRNKERLDKMLTLSYTIEKDGNHVSVENRLMINESQINNLMDSLVAHGYTVEEMSVESDTITPTIHWTERK